MPPTHKLKKESGLDHKLLWDRTSFPLCLHSSSASDALFEKCQSHVSVVLFSPFSTVFTSCVYESDSEPAVYPQQRTRDWMEWGQMAIQCVPIVTEEEMHSIESVRVQLKSPILYSRKRFTFCLLMRCWCDALLLVTNLVARCSTGKTGMGALQGGWGVQIADTRHLSNALYNPET